MSNVTATPAKSGLRAMLARYETAIAEGGWPHGHARPDGESEYAGKHRKPEATK